MRRLLLPGALLAIVGAVLLIPATSQGDTCFTTHGEEPPSKGFRPTGSIGIVCEYTDCGIPIANLSRLVGDRECRGAMAGRVFIGGLASLGLVTVAMGARRRREGWPERAAAWP